MTGRTPTPPHREPGQLARSRDSEKTWQTVQNRRAARTVASQALDGHDCLALLAMLGLEPTDGKPERPPAPW